MLICLNKPSNPPSVILFWKALNLSYQFGSPWGSTSHTPPFTPLPPIVGSNGGYCVSWPDHRSFLYFWKVLKAADAKTRPPETLTKADFKLFSARNNLFRQPQLIFFLNKNLEMI